MTHGPRGDIDRRIDIRVRWMPAGATATLGLRHAVGLVHGAAHRTCSTGVPWINDGQWHTGDQRFIGDELAELMKRPTAMFGPVRVPYRCPRANALEVFQGKSATGVFGCFDQALGNDVVVIPPEVRFIFQGLLQRVDGCLGQPGRLLTVAPLGEPLASPSLAECLLALLKAFLWQRQRLVGDKPTRASKTAHLLLLFAVWHQLKLERLEP